MATLSPKSVNEMPAFVLAHFLGSFEGKLRVATLAASLPFDVFPAPIQSGIAIKGEYALVDEAVEKGAAELADNVDRIAEAAGATHVSFEDLDGPTSIHTWERTRDAKTGVSVRLIRWYDIGIYGGDVWRFEVCYRLWKLLPGEPFGVKPQ